VGGHFGLSRTARLRRSRPAASFARPAHADRAGAGRPGEAMNAILNLIDNVIWLYIWVLLFAVVMSWLISFNVVNTSNRVVYLVADFLYKATEPALRPIRRLLPSLGGLDISPIILILLLYFVRDLLFEIVGRR
jgi:YggT family protein